MKKALLFYPLNMIHERRIKILEGALPGWKIKKIYNPRIKRYRYSKIGDAGAVKFVNGRVPTGLFNDIDAVISFTAYPYWVPTCNLVQEAAQNCIPFIVIEEGHEMMLKQGYMNNYVLPMDHFFVSSEYEKKKFIECGIPECVMQTIGSPFIDNKLLASKSKSEDYPRRLLAGVYSKPLALLSLSSLAIYNDEKIQEWQKMIAMITQALPGYELLVKLHPALEDKRTQQSLKKIAPDMKIVDLHMPIERLLPSIKVLFNRGNSQVIIDAVTNGVPVVIIPLEKKTIFHGLIDGVIANNADEITMAMEQIKDRGMSLYEPLFERHLYIPAQKAFGKVVSLIEYIAKKKELYKPQERLLELALFWAWFGYMRQSLQILNSLKSSSQISADTLVRVYRLVFYKADREDISSLRDWSSGRYLELIIKSLWIRNLFFTRKKMDYYEREWLTDYPPRVNRSHFLPYIYMLGWNYKTSGLQHEAEKLTEAVCDEYGFVREVKRWRSVIKNRNQFYSHFNYRSKFFRYKLRLAAKDFLYARGLY